MAAQVNRILELLIDWAELGRFPDPWLRFGCRRQISAQLAKAERGGEAGRESHMRALRDKISRGPIAVHTDDANLQHYAVPPSFFRHVLGPRLKYSCCTWPEGVGTLAQAEDAMLEITASRAEIEDGMEILDLGCGWGSFSLWIAERYPGCRIVAVTNSDPQKQFIEKICRNRRIDRIEVVRTNVAELALTRGFDRVVSIEMFEHLRNYQEILRRIRHWLRVDGKLFIHIFSHRNFAYLYQTGDTEDWMARNFFTGGIMPSDDLLEYFRDDMQVIRKWRHDGTEYARTIEAWLTQLDAAKDELLPILSRDQSEREGRRQLGKWRLFFMASAEFFGFRNGSEWGVSHYLLEPSRRDNPDPGIID